jgi:Uma2 family endonuclease
VATSLLDQPHRAYIAPFDVRLPKSDVIDDDRIDTVVQPDILIAGDRQKLDDRGMCGGPDWIAEVLAPSTANYDRTTKLRAYERAGVPEVWLIDISDRTVAIHRMAAGHYARAVLLQLRGQTALTAVRGVSIDWDRLLAVIEQSR